MSDVDYFIAGSIHQGSERFKGKTMLHFYEFFSVTVCSFTSAVQWRSQTIYRILDGDKIYLNALDNQVNIYSEMISLNHRCPRDTFHGLGSAVVSNGGHTF